jgi:hypothetical protein
MRAKLRTVLLAAALTGITPLVAGCGLAHSVEHSSSRAAAPPAAANPGEKQGTIPASAGEEPAPTRPAATPKQAIAAYATLYINWTYQTLPAHETALAAMGFGDARRAERQAAAQTQRDSRIQQGGIYNRGTVIGVSPVAGGSQGEYVVVTKEETGGNQEYAGLQAAFHVTFATVEMVPGGWAVGEWQPQS